MAQSVRLLREQGMPIKQIAKNLEIGVGTVYKALDKAA
jgi:DNA invertase Pin-like site-specific DNA recombinase